MTHITSLPRYNIRKTVLVVFLLTLSYKAVLGQTPELDSLKRHYQAYQQLKATLRNAPENRGIGNRNLPRLPGGAEQQNYISRLEYEKKQAVIRQRYWSGIAGLSVLLLCAGAVLSVYMAKRQRKANEELQKQKAKVTTKNRQLVQLNREAIQQNQRLEQLNRVKDQLLSIVSHDVRAPLRSIQGLVTLHNLNALSQTETNYLLDKLGGEVHHTSLLLDNILNWARSQMEGLHMQQTLFDLRDITHKNLELYGPLAEKKQLTLESKLTQPQLVYGDEEMINTVIRNLVNNAIKFSHPGGTITLSALEKENQVQFTVRDTGVGISPESLAKIFKDNPDTSIGTGQEKGTGLGLQVCKDFILQHKGQIWVDSQLNVGSAFHFTLPLTHLPANSGSNQPTLSSAFKSTQ